MKTVFLEDGVFAPCRKQVVLAKNGEMTIDILPTKTRGFAPQTWKLTKMTKMAGVTPAKPPFAKNMVFATLKHPAKSDRIRPNPAVPT